MQNGGGFRHFNHECRTSTGEIIRGANACEDLVDGAEPCGGGGDETAGISQKRNQCNRAHVCGLAAHVGTGDDQKSSSRYQAAVIGNVMLEHVLNHWVSRGGDFKAGRIVERGTAPIRLRMRVERRRRSNQYRLRRLPPS